MNRGRVVYLNGDFIALERAVVPILSHSMGRGSAIFEVISFRDTAHGPAVFRLKDHIDRLFRTAALLEIQLPLTPERFYEAVTATIRRNGLTEGVLKIICYYPQISLSIAPPAVPPDVSIFAVAPEHDFPGLVEPREEKTTAAISRWRKLDPRTIPIESKAAANYLNGMVAHQDVRRRGFRHAILLDTAGRLAEGATESIFFVREGTIHTPKTGTVLRSITRESILQAARIEGLPCAEGHYSPEDLDSAAEIFFTSSPQKTLPVWKYEERILEPVPGPLTRKIDSLMEAIASGRDARFLEWLYPV